MKRTLLAMAATAATVLAAAVPATASIISYEREACIQPNQTLRVGCVFLEWDRETRKIQASAGTWSNGAPKVGAITELTLQRRSCGGAWQTAFYDADTDGYDVFDYAESSAPVTPIRGRQWRAKAVVSWKVEGYPSTRQSVVKVTPVLGSC